MGTDRYGDELGAMQKVSRSLEGLEPAVRARVLAYAVGRFVDEAHAAPLHAAAITLAKAAG